MRPNTEPGMNRAQRRAAARTQRTRPARHKARRVDPIAGIRLLHNARPYESGGMVEEHVLTRAAFERLRTGAGSETDFDRVSMMFNIGMIRAEAIDPLLVETMQRGQMAFVRMQARYRRGLPLGFDAQGLHDVPEAIDVYEVMVDHSSPQQMIDCIKAAYARISNGEILQVPA